MMTVTFNFAVSTQATIIKLSKLPLLHTVYIGRNDDDADDEVIQLWIFCFALHKTSI